MSVCVLRLEINRYCNLEGKLKIFGKERNKPLMHKFEIHFVWLKLKFSLKIK